MHNKLKCWLRIIVFYIGKMIKIIYKKILHLTLCQLMVLFMVLIVSFVIWTYNNISVINVRVASKYPAILWWPKNFPGTSDLIKCSNERMCYVFSEREEGEYNIAAYLFYASNIDFDDLPLPRRPRDIIWALYHEESPRNVEELLHEETLNLFNFSSTFSRFSSVPFPLLHLYEFEDITSRKYFVPTAMKNEYYDIAPVMYLQSDCETSTERDAYVKELMKLVKIDSYGSCLNNKQLPVQFKQDYLNNLNDDEFLKFIARYKFVVAIENGVCNDYVTEKFWRAIKVGTVPIYFGSPSIRDWFPNNKSAILIENYPTPTILYKHIKILMKNDSLYEEYLEHKTRQIISNELLINEYKTRSYQLNSIKTIRKFECFVCTKLHDKIKGEKDTSVVNKSHYDCPKPISTLTLKVNPSNSWVYSWERAEVKAKEIYKRIIEDK